MASINSIKLANLESNQGKDGNILFSGNIKSGTQTIGIFTESAWDMPPEIEVTDKGFSRDLEHLSQKYFKKYRPVYCGIKGVDAMIADLLVFETIQNRLESMENKGALVIFTGKTVEALIVDNTITQREVELLVIAHTDNPKTKVRYFLFLSDADFEIVV